MASDALIDMAKALGAASAAGFLIGFEREWTNKREGGRDDFAGARTFTLVGFAGALAGAFDGLLIAAAGFLLVGVLTIVGYRIAASGPERRLGGTSEIALFVTYLLGLAAMEGFTLVTAVGAVTVAVVLNLKDEISKVAGSLDEREIHATLRLLVVSVLVLPLLPNAGYGPYDAINPRGMWKMVVFISGLSFAGYWLMRWLGPGKGVLVTGLVGGLASSTATTASLSRRARDGGPVDAFAAGIVAANVVMLARIGVLFAALAPAVAQTLAPTLIAGALAGAAAAVALSRRSARQSAAAPLDIGNPFELRPALLFAALFGAIALASAWGAENFGAAGRYVVALVSGLADVDAVTLTSAKDAASGAVNAHIAATAALLAAATNIVVKAIMSFAAGGPALGARVALAFAAIVAAATTAHLIA